MFMAALRKNINWIAIMIEYHDRICLHKNLQMSTKNQRPKSPENSQIFANFFK